MPAWQAAGICFPKEQIERFVDSLQWSPIVECSVLDTVGRAPGYYAAFPSSFFVGMCCYVEGLLGPTSDLVLSRIASRARSAEDACTDEIIWTKKDAQVESFTRWIVHELNWFTRQYELNRWWPTTTLLHSGKFKGSTVWRRKQVLEVQWGLKQLLLGELRGTKFGVGWGGVDGSAIGWGYGECAHHCAQHILFFGKKVRCRWNPVHTLCLLKNVNI